MLMPIGRHKGRPVADMDTTYLAWLVCNDSIRFNRWDLVQEVLRVLRQRFEKFDDLLVELRVEAPPPEYWKAKKPDRTAEKAEKLRLLTRQRIEEAKAALRIFG